jgi:hypothetical protein
LRAVLVLRLAPDALVAADRPLTAICSALVAVCRAVIAVASFADAWFTLVVAVVTARGVA